MASSSSESSSMPYRYLGSSGARVSAIALGTMNFSLSSSSAHFDVLDAFLAAGGNFIDTADVYSGGESEKAVGEWIKERGLSTGSERSRIFLATKVHFGGGRTGPNDCGLSRVHIRATVEQSLESLQTPFIDLLQIHNWDEGTSVREWLKTLNNLIDEGKIRFFGVCNVTGWQLQKIVSTAEALGLQGPVSVQNQYSLLSRQTEWEVLHCAAVNGIAFLPWSPLKGGWLTGKFRKDVEPDPDSRVGQVTAKKRPQLQSSPDYSMFANDRTWNLLAVMDKCAASHGATVAQVAVRWLLQRPAVQSVLLGPRNVAQLADCLGAKEFTLSDEEMTDLCQASAVDIPYPYEMVWRACRPGEKGRVDGNLWPIPHSGLSNM